MACGYKFTAFMTHDWGTKEDGHENHKRVAEIFHALKKRGLNPWFDEEAMQGDITAAMQTGIDESACAIYFLTKRYLEKVNSKNPADNCLKNSSTSQ